MTARQIEATMIAYTASPLDRYAYPAVDDLMIKVRATESTGKELFCRFGFAPEEGYSINHANGLTERGVSMYDVEDRDHKYGHIMDRPLVWYRGISAGWGSDYEPLATDLEIVAVVRRTTEDTYGYNIACDA